MGQLKMPQERCGGWVVDGGMPRSSHVHPARVGSDARRVIAVWALLSGSMMGFLSVGLLVVYALGEGAAISSAVKPK